MEWIEALLTNNFDFSFIVLIIFGNFYIYDLSFYPQKILSWKKSKTLLTALHSLLLGVLYYFILQYLANETPNVRILLNSFLLATSLYEFGMKEALQYFKEHGSTLLLNKIKEKTDDSSKV